MEDTPGQSVYTQLSALARHNPGFVQSLNSIVTQNIILAEDSELTHLLSGDQVSSPRHRPDPKVDRRLGSPPGYTKPDPNAKNPQLMNMLYSAFQARISKQAGGLSQEQQPLPPTHQPQPTAVASPPPPPPPPAPPSEPPPLPPPSGSSCLMSLPPPPAFAVEAGLQWQQFPPPNLVPHQLQPDLSHLNPLGHQYLYPQFLPMQSLWPPTFLLPPPPHVLPHINIHPETVHQSPHKRKLSGQGFGEFESKRLCPGT